MVRILLLLIAVLVAIQPANTQRAGNSQPFGTYNEWRVDVNDGSAEAFTANGSGSIFGVICLESCSGYLNNQQQCDADGTYPMMANTNAGALPLNAGCFITGNGRHFLIFGIDDNWIDIIRTGGVVGFALPMQSGEFHVSRFSLNGAAEALTALSDVIEGQQGQFLRDRTY